MFGRFSNFDKCRPEAAGGVISGRALDDVCTDVSAGFGDSRLNSARIIRLFVRPDPFCALLCSSQSQFATDRNELVMSHMQQVCEADCLREVRKSFVILA